MRWIFVPASFTCIILIAFVALILHSPVITSTISAMLRQASPILANPLSALRTQLTHLHKPLLPTFLTFTSLLHHHHNKKQHNPFTTSPPKMSTTKTPFADAIHARRTNYALTSTSPIPNSRITDLITSTLKDVPSAFNSQTTRIVAILGKEEHSKLWTTILEVYKAMLAPEKFEHFKGRAEGFRGAYGTLLFYEDGERMREFQERFKSYEDKFPQCMIFFFLFVWPIYPTFSSFFLFLSFPLLTLIFPFPPPPSHHPPTSHLPNQPHP